MCAYQNLSPVLIGNSLGGIFLAKYLSENRLPHKATSVILVAPPFDDSASTEELSGGFELGDDLPMIFENTETLYMLFSADDEVVPPVHAQKYHQALPAAKVVVLEGKNGHFRVPELPELLHIIESGAFTVEPPV